MAQRVHSILSSCGSGFKSQGPSAYAFYDLLGLYDR